MLLNLKILLSFWDVMRQRDFIFGETMRLYEKWKIAGWALHLFAETLSCNKIQCHDIIELL